MGAKRSVIQFFLLGISFVMLIAIIQFSYFGSITGFAISERQSVSSDLSSGQFVGTEMRDGKIVLSSSQNSGDYTSEIIDLGKEVEVRNFDWEGDSEGGDVYYATREGEDEEDAEVVVSYDNGESWEILENNQKAAQVLAARNKGDLHEKVNSEVIFEIRVCQVDDCSDSDFQVITPGRINLDGRYVQYRISFEGVGGSYVEDVEISYVSSRREGGEERASEVTGSELGAEDIPPEEDKSEISEIFETENNNSITLDEEVKVNESV